MSSRLCQSRILVFCLVPEADEFGFAIQQKHSWCFMGNQRASLPVVCINLAPVLAEGKCVSRKSSAEVNGYYNWFLALAGNGLFHFYFSSVSGCFLQFMDLPKKNYKISNDIK